MIMTLDPSSRSMGIALWGSRTLNDVPLPTTTALLVGRKGDWMESAKTITNLLTPFLERGVTKLYCEQPAYHGGKSHKTASSGALVKLTTSAGMVAGLCAYMDIEFEYVQIRDWKGNLPKQIVIDRICKLYGKSEAELSFKKDVWDAVGIGLFVKEYF